MPDQRRTFSTGRAQRTNATQTTGRTRVLGVPNNGTTIPSVPRAGVAVPGAQLNPQSGKGPSTLSESARTSDYGSAI